MIRIILGTVLALVGAFFLSVAVLATPDEGSTRGELVVGSMILGIPPLVIGLLLIRSGGRAVRRAPAARSHQTAPPPPPPPPERGFPRGPSSAGIERVWSGGSVDASTPGPESLVRASSLAVSDAGHLVAGYPDGLIRAWRLPGMDSGDELVGHGTPVILLAMDGAGERLVSRAAPGAGGSAAEAGLRMWDLAAGSPTWELQTARTVVALQASRDGQFVVAGAVDGAVDAWDAFSSPEAAWSTGQFQQVTALAFAPDDRTYASGGADGRIRIGRVMEHETRDGGMHPGVSALAFVGPHRLLSAGLDQRVRLWNLETGTCEAELETAAPVAAMAFRTADRAAVIATEDGSVSVWNLAARQPLARTEPLADGPCRAVISRDGRYAVVRSQAEAAVYRIES